MAPRIAVFCMPEMGHFQLLRPMIAGLARHGARIRAYSHRDYEARFRTDGAEFEDIFGKYPLELADDASIPISCRYVSYAARYAEEIAQDVKRFGPQLVICETFSLIGRVVAGMLNVPWINVSPGHNLQPEVYAGKIERNPLLSVSPECHRAVSSLRDRGWVPDATPFSFITSLSPFLNICCEPPSFLDPDSRRVFEPLAFFGSLPEDAGATSGARDDSPFVNDGRIRVYVCFGTIVWRYYRREALAALGTISAFAASRSDVEALISLGGATLGADERRMLEKPNVRVETYVDQPEVLRHADIFVTHHGINSTHEAIVNRVPMLSYPFFWDQPSMAKTCQNMGLAVPLGDTERAPLTEATLVSAMHALSVGRDARMQKLESARRDELDVVRGRSEVFQRVLSFAAR